MRKGCERGSLAKDTRKYGLPLPKELKEVMSQDRAGEKLFHALTPGKPAAFDTLDRYGRADVDKRMSRLLILMEYLKYTVGKFVYN